MTTAGRKAGETNEHHSRQIAIAENGQTHTKGKESHIQHFRFEYIDDAKGNWTERVVWSREKPDADFHRSNAVRRRIAYYAA